MKYNQLKGSLMIQGTTSDAGKSILVAGLCRLLSRNGVSIAPFKPQNMALNSAVTIDGGEIGRAQALQAVACNLEPHCDFNPVLLKPSSDRESQVIVNGKAVSQLDARTFGNIKALAFDSVIGAYQRLQQRYDVILIEGAGSPAEMNLRQNDIANMGFAEAVDCPVVLISDIDRGGVFAHLTGTINLLSKSEQQRIKGLIINKFRGELKLLQSGLDWLENYTNKPLLGVLPFIQDLKLDAEDAIRPVTSRKQSSIHIVVVVLPRISNHTDFEPLAAQENVDVEYLKSVEQLTKADLIIIPGSKNVRDDLKYLKDSGWQTEINRHLRYGGKLLGICGGFQMLGHSIKDIEGVEGPVGEEKGLQLLSLTTSLQSEKQLKQVVGEFEIGRSHGKISGYEIRCGNSVGKSLERPFSRVTDQFGTSYCDGAVSEDSQIIGSYIHGLFENKEVMEAILYWISGESVSASNWRDVRETELERLADMLQENLDLETLLTSIN